MHVCKRSMGHVLYVVIVKENCITIHQNEISKLKNKTGNERGKAIKSKLQKVKYVT